MFRSVFLIFSPGQEFLHLFSPLLSPSQELEHAFWMDFERGRAVCAPAPPPPAPAGLSTPCSQALARDGGVVLLNRYWGALEPPTGPGEDDAANVGGGRGVSRPLPFRPPRPESYREDKAAAHGICSCSGGRGKGGGGGGGEGGEGVKEGRSVCGVEGEGGVGPSGICHELAAAAESGWDFSSRWGGSGGCIEVGAGAGGRVAGGENSAADNVVLNRLWREGSEKDFSNESNINRVGGGVANVGNDTVSGGGGACGRVEGSPGEGGAGGAGTAGRDASSRSSSFCLCQIATTAVVPADLNAFMHRAELNIARLHHAHHVASLAASCHHSPTLASVSSCPSPLPSDAGANAGADSDQQNTRPRLAETAAAATSTAVGVEAQQQQTSREECTRVEEQAKAAGSGGGGGGGDHNRDNNATGTATTIATNSTPPPPLLTLDEIQRRYLSRDRRTYGSSSGFIFLDCLPPEVTAGGGPATRQCRTDSDDRESSSEAAAGYGVEFDVRVVESQGALCQKAMLLLAAARARAKAMEQTMWDDRQALWRDLLLPTGTYNVMGGFTLEYKSEDIDTFAKKH